MIKNLKMKDEHWHRWFSIKNTIAYAEQKIANEETKKIISEKNSVKVVQIDKDTNEIINVFKSAKEAGNYFGKPRGNAEILKVCRGRFKIQNGHIKHNRTAYGFRWKYLKDIEGSTTIEEDGKIYYRP